MVLVGGSHVDSMLGVNSIFDTVLQLVAGFVPAGNTAATYALSTGWINDFYAGATPQTPQYGLYAGANQQIIFGNAAGIALPTPTLNQIGPVGDADLGAEGRLGRQQPAPLRDLAGGTVPVADAVPEAVQIRRIGKDAADPDDGDRWSGWSHQAASSWTHPGCDN